ncbi:MAG: efflux transporter outer membrane subunit [Planctomycetota bacterium]
MRAISSTGVAAITVLLAAGCAVGPDYEGAPPTAAIDAFAAADEADFDGDPAELRAWWRRLGDDALDGAIQQALEVNHDLRIATARLAEVHALRRSARSRLGPSLQAGVDVTRTRSSENTILGRVFGSGGIGFTQNAYSTGVDAAWELDLFGGVRRGVEAADARLDAATAQWRAVRLSLVAEVARVWIERAGTERRIAIAEEQVELQQGTLDLVQAKVRAGLARRLEIDRARSQLEATRSVLPSLQAGRAAQAHRLAVLLGQHPSDAPPPAPQLCQVPPTVSLGVPGELLRRRPDVRAAEREFAAATADIGVAVAELYPKLFVLGGASLQSAGSGDWIEPASRAWQLGPAIRWRLFESDRLHAEVEGRRAARAAAMARFEQTVLIALEDVETAAVNHQRERTRQETLLRATTAARAAASRAGSLYDAGLTDFLTVLDAERRRNDAEQALIGSEIALRTSVVVLFKALGGGWAEAE